MKADPRKVHVLYSGGGWCLKSHGGIRRRPGKFLKQSDAIDAALTAAKTSKVYVHRPDGTVQEVLELPSSTGARI